MHLIEKHIDELNALCKKYKVKSLYVFGSVLTERFNDESDVDFLFNFDPEIDYNNYADYYFELLEKLKDLFGREIDLVDERTLRNPYFIKEIEATKQNVYG